MHTVRLIKKGLRFTNKTYGVVGYCCLIVEWLTQIIVDNFLVIVNTH